MVRNVKEVSRDDIRKSGMTRDRKNKKGRRLGKSQEVREQERSKVGRGGMSGDRKKIGRGRTAGDGKEQERKRLGEAEWHETKIIKREEGWERQNDKRQKEEESKMVGKTTRGRENQERKMVVRGRLAGG